MWGRTSPTTIFQWIAAVLGWPLNFYVLVTVAHTDFEGGAFGCRDFVASIAVARGVDPEINGRFVHFFAAGAACFAQGGGDCARGDESGGSAGSLDAGI